MSGMFVAEPKDKSNSSSSFAFHKKRSWNTPDHIHRYHTNSSKHAANFILTT
jgi:hypothetical protein